MSTIHVLPNDDLVDHEARGDGCICGPEVDYLEEGAKIVTHHSLDGRESASAPTKGC